MLQTLLKIGEWQSQDKSKWYRFLDYPKIEREDKKGNPIRNYTFSIVFDLDEKAIDISEENLKEYDDRDVENLKALQVKGGNNKAIYVTVPGKKIEQICKTFFDKLESNSENGQLVEAINKLDKALLTNDLNTILQKVFQLKSEFIQKFSDDSGIKIQEKKLKEHLNLGAKDNLVLVNVKIKYSKEGYDTPISFSEIEAYKDFLNASYFKPESNNTDKNKKSQKLCYASGEIRDDVEAINLDTRYSINKMFVTETKNYANNFNNKNFYSNYQVSNSNQEKLDYASDFLLNVGAYKVKIANLDHVIIPEFLSTTKIEVEDALEGIKKKSDLLFNFKTLEADVLNMEDELRDEIFWINFLAYESDGNFFKSTHLIKDVSSFHFQKVIKTFEEVHWKFQDSKFVDWAKVMTEYGNEVRFFNLNSIYGLIPLRKEKEKVNKALILFKAVFENRKINFAELYDYFSELILCHYFERYNSYNNIPKSSKDYFSLAVRNSVFKYHAFIQVLKKLNLIDMEETNDIIDETLSNEYDQAIHSFFNEMQFTKEQQAMFYLGRMLNAVEYIQKDKKKTVIQKVNFNGMDKDDIQRLRIDLIEKAKQYNKMNKVIFTDEKFGKLFSFNTWAMNPKEAVFFLLTGYSFNAGKPSQAPTETIND